MLLWWCSCSWGTEWRCYHTTCPPTIARVKNTRHHRTHRCATRVTAPQGKACVSWPTNSPRFFNAPALSRKISSGRSNKGRRLTFTALMQSANFSPRHLALNRRKLYEISRICDKVGELTESFVNTLDVVIRRCSCYSSIFAWRGDGFYVSRVRTTTCERSESDVGEMRRTYPSSTPPERKESVLSVRKRKKAMTRQQQQLDTNMLCVVQPTHSRSHSLDRHTSKIASRLSLARRESMTSHQIEWSFVFSSFSISLTLSSTSTSYDNSGPTLLSRTEQIAVVDGEKTRSTALFEFLARFDTHDGLMTGIAMLLLWFVKSK